MATVKVRNQVGTQSEISKALEIYAVSVAKELQYQQVDKDFMATGQTLDSYEVLVAPRNKVSIVVPGYYYTMVDGAKPEEVPPMNVFAKWIQVKGITPDEGQSINSLAYAMARKQFNEGNAVYRGEREGIDLDEAASDGWDAVSNEIGDLVGKAAADLLVANAFKMK